MIDAVSGAEVPEPHIAVSPAMRAAGWCCVNVDLASGKDFALDTLYRAMRRVEIAEARAAQYNALNPACPSCNRRDGHELGCDEVGCADDSFRPAGYRNAGKDEPK